MKTFRAADIVWKNHRTDNEDDQSSSRHRLDNQRTDPEDDQRAAVDTNRKIPGLTLKTIREQLSTQTGKSQD